MRFAKLCVVLMVVVFGLNIAACCGGGTTTVQEKQIISTPTVGVQLEDLDKAYKNGSITKEEYDKLKKDIMNKAAESK